LIFIQIKSSKALIFKLFHDIIKETAVILMARKKKYIISLTDDNVKRLKSIIRKKSTTRTIKCRCQILLSLDEAHGKQYTQEQCAKSIGVCRATVYNVIKYYIEGGIDKVLTVDRSINSDNARRKLNGRAEAKLIEIACGPAPEGFARWTLRLLEEHAKVELEVPVSKDTIGRALKKTNYDLTKTPIGVSRRKKTQNS
jgi:transposase